MIGLSRQIFLLCDSWYSKVKVAGLVKEFGNLDIICNAPDDTVMHELHRLYWEAQPSQEVWGRGY